MTKNIKEQVDTDIRRFMDNIENQNHSDRIETLKNMFDKYLHLNTCDYLMDYYDLNIIIGSAKGKYSRDTMPVYLGEKKRKVGQHELGNMAIVEATITHLNRNGCLKKIPKFDKREDTFQED